MVVAQTTTTETVAMAVIHGRTMMVAKIYQVEKLNTWSGPGSIVVGLTCVCKHGLLRCLILCLLRLLAARAVYFCMFGMSASGPKVGGFGVLTT